MIIYTTLFFLIFFFLNDTATPEIYTLSLHDALPILAMASSSVAIGLGFAGALKPIWLSEICRKVKPLAACALASEIPSNDDDRGTPPTIVHSTPVPAQIMHSNAPRRSMPSRSFCPICSLPRGH